MANATQVQASKFFAARPAMNVVKEHDFETLTEFKQAIAEYISTIPSNSRAVTFQHKSFKRGSVWSINLQQLEMYCTKCGARIAQIGNRDNNYTWLIVPRTTLVSQSPF